MSVGCTFCSLHETFTVRNWVAARPLLEQGVRLMGDACVKAGVVFYGWTRSGDTLFCRQAFSNVEGLLMSLGTLHAVTEALCDGPATLDACSLHAPLPKMEECRLAIGDAGYQGVSVDYYRIDSGFQKYELTLNLGRPMGMLDLDAPLARDTTL